MQSFECMQKLLLFLAAIFLDPGLVTTAIPCDEQCKYSEQDVDCFGLGLTDLPDGCEDAIALDAGRNLIAEINGGTFQGYPHLQYLYMGNNRITAVTAGGFLPFADTLQNLDLGNNMLSRLDNFTFASMTRLQQLDLRFNQIASIESQAFKSLPNLTHLFLSDNAITSLPLSVFDEMPGLKHLLLSNNRLSQIHSRLFVHLGSLLHLRLTNNTIVSLDGSPLSLGRLRSIHLARNRITLFDCQWISQTSARLTANLSHNLIETVVNCHSQVNQLLLDSNPFDCSCEHRGLVDVFRAYRGETVPMCSTPPVKRNMSITEKTFEDCYVTDSPKVPQTRTPTTVTTNQRSSLPALATHSSPSTTAKRQPLEKATLETSLSKPDSGATFLANHLTSDTFLYAVIASIVFLGLLGIFLFGILLYCRRKNPPQNPQNSLADPNSVPLRSQSNPQAQQGGAGRHIYQEIPGERPSRRDQNPNDVPLLQPAQAQCTCSDYHTRHIHHLSDSQDSGLADHSQRNSVSDWIQNNIHYMPITSASSTSSRTQWDQFEPSVVHPQPPRHSNLNLQQSQSPQRSHHWYQSQLPEHPPNSPPPHPLARQHSHPPFHHHVPQHAQQVPQSESPKRRISAVTPEKRPPRRCSTCSCHRNGPRARDQTVSPQSEPLLHQTGLRTHQKSTHCGAGYIPHNFID